MQMTGEQRIAAPRHRVWDALNDPAVLARAIPGCQSLDREGDDRFAAVAEVRIGPIGARFRGQVQLTDIDAPNGYTINGSGQGGIAGNARGTARVRLSDVDGGTLVSYVVEAEVGGRMAQLGGPIIDATEVIAGGSAAAPTLAASAAAAPAARAVAAAPSAGSGIAGWIAALVLALAAGFWLGRSHPGAASLLLTGALLVAAALAAFAAGRRGSAR